MGTWNENCRVDTSTVVNFHSLALLPTGKTFWPTFLVTPEGELIAKLARVREKKEDQAGSERLS